VGSKLKEPSVISLHMIKSALEALDEENAALSNPGSSVVREPTTPESSDDLRLSFRGLVRIQNLDILKCLKRLQLDNNKIKVIEGLSCVAGTLEWLDLSFNSIEDMNGLGDLPRLTDLTLFHNSIQKVTGLSGCASLQCLSLGENKIDDLTSSVMYLRKIPTLEVLTLEGNPLCNLGEGGRDVYRPYFIAFCSKLKYLDYQLITASDREAAREGGVPSEKLAEVEDADASQAELLEKARLKAVQLADYVSANLEVIETIYSDLFEGEEGNAGTFFFFAHISPKTFPRIARTPRVSIYFMPLYTPFTSHRLAKAKTHPHHATRPPGAARVPGTLVLHTPGGRHGEKPSNQ